MGACLDAGKELAKAYKDTPTNTARQSAAVQNFFSLCMGGTAAVASPGSTIPSTAGAATTQPNASTPMGQLETGTLSGVLDSVRSSPYYGWAVLGFWLVVAYVGVVAVLGVVKKVRHI